ncbi:DUF4288 domain-containing protein [Solitalea sp. MAHUQ-68]|uniref:DUF4288 domain-containing protein n=1 Tax=Solitalea agri TaxID=2953739 RepID=A0A9X2JCR4_9SPHI|nr:DUF4288 domain-containing protein [Solitalea agri]MCO4293767.1 DUF4288 domain-containing protein [Solitalea agri]
MEWFIAKLVYQIQSGEGKHQPQFDEQLRLIQAEDFSTALSKAKEVGVDQQSTFFNVNKELVSWRFVDIVALDKIHSVTDKSEVYSEIVEADSAAEYLNDLKIKARKVRRQLIQVEHYI